MKSQEEIEAMFAEMRAERAKYIEDNGGDVEAMIRHDMEIAPLTTNREMLEMIGASARIESADDVLLAVEALRVWNIHVEDIPEITPGFIKAFDLFLGDQTRMVAPCADMQEVVSFSNYKEQS